MGRQMKFAVSTLAFPGGNPEYWLAQAAAAGFGGIEIAADRAWRDAPGLPGPDAVARLADACRGNGLEIIGLHDLLDRATAPAMFAEPDLQQQAIARVVRLSAICRDLGGRTLVVGGPRFNPGLPPAVAWSRLSRFLEQTLEGIAGHGTVLCLEPLPPALGDFCISADDCRMLLCHIDHQAVGFQLGSAVAACYPQGHTCFAALRGRLDVFHVDEPDGGVLDGSGRVDHADFRRHLASISFRDWLSLHQRAGADALAELNRSMRLLRHYYLRRDNLSLERRKAAVEAGGRQRAGRSAPNQTGEYHAC